MQIKRRPFYSPERLVDEIRKKVESATEAGELIDYLTFVPNGEPTLDANLGSEIARLKPLGIRIAVITNANLIWRDDVKRDLMLADWVSLKVDAVTDSLWRKVDRPRRSLKLQDILDGALEFAQHYGGQLVTETMLVQGANDCLDSVREVADYIAALLPAVAFLSVPTRPPAEMWVHVPEENVLNQAYQVMSAKIKRVEYLIGYEGNAFSCTGNIRRDLLSITAVHPMREDAVAELLDRVGADWSAVNELVDEERIMRLDYGEKIYYVRRLGG